MTKVKAMRCVMPCLRSETLLASLRDLFFAGGCKGKDLRTQRSSRALPKKEDLRTHCLFLEIKF